MTEYRRNYVAGGSFFFTVTLAERSSNLLTDKTDILRKAFRLTQSEHPFTINAIVVLPEHLHCIWTLPTDDRDYSTRWKKIKGRFSRHIPKTERRSKSRISKGERGIWQRRFWEHTLRDETDFNRHIDYIHYNPVKHGHVIRVCDWPHSSFHQYVKQGIYPLNWAGGQPEASGEFGEI